MAVASVSERAFDVLVVGAGPAGASAAVTVAKAGLTVALIDKARFPRDKLCGGLFTGRARNVFNVIHGHDIDMALFDQHSALEFFFHGTSLDRMQDVPPMFTTMRRPFDASLRDLALAAGAVDFAGQRIASLETDPICLELADGTRLTGRVLIGADGVNSTVARALFGQAYDRATIGFALEVEAGAPHLRPGGDLQVSFGAVKGGYGWSFPKRHSTTVGVGGPVALTPDMRPGLDRYLSDCGIPSTACTVKGHLLPVGDFRAVPGQGAVLLAGDAAGLVDPVTGEGIAHAMQSGQFAALSALEALASDATDRLHRGVRQRDRVRTHRQRFDEITGLAQPTGDHQRHIRGRTVQMLPRPGQCRDCRDRDIVTEQNWSRPSAATPTVEDDVIHPDLQRRVDVSFDMLRTQLVTNGNAASAVAHLVSEVLDLRGSVPIGKPGRRDCADPRFDPPHLGDLALYLGAWQMPARAGLGRLTALEMKRLRLGHNIPVKPEPGAGKFVEIARIGFLFFGQHAAFTGTDACTSQLCPPRHGHLGRF